MAKICLSAAAHEHDNATRCGGGCSENTHCKQYMDIVERRLQELGAQVLRPYPDLVGEEAMQKRVAAANEWGADTYYVAHTNAGGGRYSMTMCWSDAASQQRAAAIGKHRQWPHGHKVRVRTDLYEIKKTKMPCLYDELFFHDNEEDCAWFHAGGMEQMAEETVQALCELNSLEYRPAEPQAPAAKTVYLVQAAAVYTDEAAALEAQGRLAAEGFAVLGAVLTV